MSNQTGRTTQITVTGMTCDHCVASVTEELLDVAGVSEVRVDLATGTVAVTSTRPLDAGAVRAAVTAAGYALA